MIPTTNLPSARPSITGSVVFIEMTQEVTASLTSEEVDDFIETAEETFGLYPGNVEAEVSYEISGTIAIETDGSDIDEVELLSALESSISSSLNVHPSDVEITIDPESGEVTYTISSATSEEAAVLLGTLQGEPANEAIASAVADILPEITQVIFLDHCFP